MRDRVQLQRAPRVCVRRRRRENCIIHFIRARTRSERDIEWSAIAIILIAYFPAIVWRAVASLMDMRLDLFVLHRICVQSAQHLVANVRSRYKFIYFSVTAVAGVEFLTSNTHARCAAPRWMCTHTHSQLYGRKRLRRNWVICQWSARGSPAANKYEVKWQCQQLCKSYLSRLIWLSILCVSAWIWESRAAGSPFWYVFGARQTCCLQARGALPACRWLFSIRVSLLSARRATSAQVNLCRYT